MINKKWILIVSGVILILFIIIIYIIFSTSQKPQQQTSDPTASGQNDTTQNNNQNLQSNPNPNITNNSNSVNSTPSWQIGENDLYTISYLSDWNPRVTAMNGGGINALFKPNSLKATETIPYFKIQAYPSNPDIPISKIITGLSAPGLTNSTMTLNYVPATQLFGTIDDTSNPRVLIPKKIFQQYILAEKNNYTFILSYAYYDNSDGDKYQQIFDIMTNSFKFK